MGGTRRTGRAGPRERLREVGAEHLSDGELLAVLLGTGRRAEPVDALAARLLHTLGGLSRLRGIGLGGLEAVPGLGPGKASRLVAAVEVGRRALRGDPGRRRVRTSRDVDRLVRARLAGVATERFLAVALDARSGLIACQEVARGGVASCPVAPSEVFRLLLREAAAAAVVVHNHPSGDPSPSAEDVALTSRLVEAGALLGVPILDHVIVAREGYFSFADGGLLHAPRRLDTSPCPVLISDPSFLESAARAVGSDARRGRPPPILEDPGEAHVPAAPDATASQARLPRPHEDPDGSSDHQSASREGPQAPRADGLQEVARRG